MLYAPSTMLIDRKLIRERCKRSCGSGATARFSPVGRTEHGTIRDHGIEFDVFESAEPRRAQNHKKALLMRCAVSRESRVCGSWSTVYDW